MDVEVVWWFIGVGLEYFFRAGATPSLSLPSKNHASRLDELLFERGHSRHHGTYWAKLTSDGKRTMAGPSLAAATSVHYPARGLKNN
eukprot:scaffold15565_cov41-Cyclotella_meneghiniana.AAC.2